MEQIHSRNARTIESLNFLLFNFSNNSLFFGVSHNEIFDFFTRICVFKTCVNFAIVILLIAFVALANVSEGFKDFSRGRAIMDFPVDDGKDFSMESQQL